MDPEHWHSQAHRRGSIGPLDGPRRGRFGRIAPRVTSQVSRWPVSAQLPAHEKRLTFAAAKHVDDCAHVGDAADAGR